MLYNALHRFAPLYDTETRPVVLDGVLDWVLDRVLGGVHSKGHSMGYSMGYSVGSHEGAFDRTFDGCQRPNSGTEPHTAMHSPHTVGCADVSTSNVNCGSRE